MGMTMARGQGSLKQYKNFIHLRESLGLSLGFFIHAGRSAKNAPAFLQREPYCICGTYRHLQLQASPASREAARLVLAALHKIQLNIRFWPGNALTFHRGALPV